MINQLSKEDVIKIEGVAAKVLHLGVDNYV